jgi:TrmH family RNA methyltransferase
MELITSRQNPNFKHIRKILEDKRYRTQYQEFWIDGVAFVNQAISNDWDVKRVLYVPESIDSDFKREVLNKVAAYKKIEVSSGLYEALSNKNDIQGIGALVAMKYKINTLFNGFGVVLENISNPGNLGMIMRTCAAFGIQNIYIINPAVDPFSIESVRSSMEAIFSLNIGVFDSVDKFAEALKANKFLNIGTSLQKDSIEIKEFNQKFKLDDNTILWLGNESKGMTQKAKDLCDKLINIKMSPNVDSLNIGASAAIFIYELVS